MKSNWEEVKLGDICTLGDGAHTKLKRLETGIKYLTSKNIKNGKLDLNKVDFISEADFEKKISNSKSSVRNLQTGDVLFSIIGSLGNVYLYKDCDKFGISSSIAIIRPNDKINSEFLYYILSSEYFNKLIENVKGGSVQGYTNLPLLRSLSINIPNNLNEQKKIAKILSCLDEKIELNNKINANLEEQAQAVFKSWFVDFEPFGGVMPSDWEKKELETQVNIKRGGSPRPIQEYLVDEGLKWLKISDATATKSSFISEIKESIKQEGLNKTIFLKKGSLVLSNSATPGIPKILAIDSCIHDGWLYFKDSIFSNEYSYLLFKDIRNDLVSKGNGSVFTNLKTDI